MAPAPISLCSSGNLSPWGMTFGSSGSPEVKGVRDSHIASGLIFLIPFHTPDGLTNRTYPFMSCRLVLPSLHRCYTSSFLLYLCPFGNLLRSRSIPVFCDRRFSLIIWADSILFQFVLRDLMKENGGTFSLSICNFSAAPGGCHWHPSSMSQFPMDFSSRYPAFEAAARQAETEQLDHMDLWLPLFSDGHKNSGDFTRG